MAKDVPGVEAGRAGTTTTVYEGCRSVHPQAETGHGVVDSWNHGTCPRYS